MSFTQIKNSLKETGSGLKKKSLLEPGQVFDLEKKISYGEGAVVSRTLVNNDCGTVTLFAFDEGQGLSEHTAPFDALVNIVEGESEIVIDGRPNRVCKGQLILMPANVPHALNAVTPFKMLLTMLRR